MKLIQEEHDARQKTQGTNNQYIQAKKSESDETHHFHGEDKTPIVRAEIATEHNFADEEEAKEWIIKNALGTRNLTEADYKMLIATLYKMRKKKHGGSRGTAKDAAGRFTASTQNANLRSKEPNRISEQIATELGVSKDTVIRAEQFANGLDAEE